MKYTWLVVSTPLKNMKVSWDDCSQLFLESRSKFQGSSHHQPAISLTTINHY